MNSRFAKQMITHFVEQGVRYACLSPGSRSTPLAIAAAKEKRLEKLVHFDERGMAFHAYGYAKGSGSPTLVITTSGSAAGNLFPAVMEAFHDHIPLIIVTADRPTELRDCMANQACDQVKLFGCYVRWHVEIPAAEPLLSDAWLGGAVAAAVHRAMHPPRGPVHINCQFREPFSFEDSAEKFPSSTHHESSHFVISGATAEKWAGHLSSCRQGVIVVGATSSPLKQEAIFSLAKTLDWPILPDLMSGLRSGHSHPAVIPYYLNLLNFLKKEPVDCVLHLGDRLVSKPLQTWLLEIKPATYLTVASHPFRYDPSHQVSHRIVMEPSLFCEHILPFFKKKHSSWLKRWQTASALLEKEIDTIIPTLSEPGMIRYLHHHLPSHYGIFFANSMPIRDGDRWFFPRSHQGPIFGQRGLSGIDGNIATAIGLAKGSGRPLVAILGDLATLHDLNSLAQLKNSSVTLILLVMNNRGGGIFSFLPVSKQKDVFENYFALAHNWHFDQAAKQFDVPYALLTHPSQLDGALKEGKTALFEFASDRHQNVLIHETIDRKTSEILKPCDMALL